MQIGIIAEDETDCDTIEVLIRRIIDDRRSIGIKKHWGNGCAQMRRKAAAWMRALSKRACYHVILVHDLDRNPLNNCLNQVEELRSHLVREIATPCDVNALICIPVEEIEAWFWSDQKVVERVGRGSGKASVSPHNIKKPKEKLITLSAKANGRPRYSTNDNPDLAASLDLAICAERCPAFHKLREFILETTGLKPPS